MAEGWLAAGVVVQPEAGPLHPHDQERAPRQVGGASGPDPIGGRTMATVGTTYAAAARLRPSGQPAAGRAVAPPP